MGHPVVVRKICYRQFKLGLTASDISSLTGVPSKTVERWITKWNTEDRFFTESELFGDDRGRPSIMSINDLLIVCKLLAQDGTLYSDELALQLKNNCVNTVKSHTMRYWLKKWVIQQRKYGEFGLYFIHLYIYRF